MIARFAIPIHEIGHPEVRSGKLGLTIHQMSKAFSYLL
jgi:hypothetical protein